MSRTPKTSEPARPTTYVEKAMAGRMSKSAFQHVARFDPPLLPTGPDVRVVRRLGSIGGFVDGGVPLILSAQIAQALAREFDDGEAPSGLKEIAEKEATAEELAALPADANDFHYHQLIVRAEERWMREATTNAKKLPVDDVSPFDYWEHVTRDRDQTGKYYAGLVPARPSDVRIEICDRRHVFMWPTSRLKSFWQDSASERAFRAKHPRHPDRPAPEEPGFVGWIEGWSRDTEMRFKHVSEVIQMDPNEEPHRSRIARLKAEHGEEKYREWYGDDHHDEQWRGNAARLQVQAVQEVLPNASGKLIVNVSLAIRRAFDRIAEHRWSQAPRLIAETHP